MRRQTSLVTKITSFETEILVTRLEIFPYEHSSLVTRMKLERSHLVNLSNQAKISHMNSHRAEISHMNRKQNLSRYPGQPGYKEAHRHKIYFTDSKT